MAKATRTPAAAKTSQASQASQNNAADRGELRSESRAGVGESNSSPTPGASSLKSMDGATYRSVPRSMLRDAPYNPRTIDQYAQQGLRESIKQTGGLIETPVWNKRTGNLVAGHQRLAQTDKLAGNQEYAVTVAVIDVDEKTERELNVRLNNDTIRGEYDVGGIDELLRGGADYQAMGFDLTSLENLYLAAGYDFDMSILVGGDSGSAIEGDSEGRDAAADVADQIDEADRAKLAEKEAKKIAEYKRKKRDFQEKTDFANQTDVSVVVLFPTAEMKLAFMRAIQRPEFDQRIDGISMCKFLELDIPGVTDLQETKPEPGFAKTRNPGDNAGVNPTTEVPSPQGTPPIDTRI